MILIKIIRGFISAGRRFDILINDKRLAEVTLPADKGPTFYSVDYPIPADMILDSTVPFRVKFVAKPGSIAGGLYEVRLLKSEPTSTQ